MTPEEERQNKERLWILNELADILAEDHRQRYNKLSKHWPGNKKWRVKY